LVEADFRCYARIRTGEDNCEGRLSLCQGLEVNWRRSSENKLSFGELLVPFDQPLEYLIRLGHAVASVARVVTC
jgi:hypothetical protein